MLLPRLLYHQRTVSHLPPTLAILLQDLARHVRGICTYGHCFVPCSHNKLESKAKARFLQE